MLKGAKGCAFGLLIGTILRTFMVVVDFLARIIAKILVLFGLWIPLVYALFGVALYYLYKFDPFDFSLYSSLYLSGALACVVSCVIISIRNIIVRPAKSIYDGYRHPLWEKDREKNIEKENDEFEKYVVRNKGEELSPPEIDEFESHKYHKKNVDFLPPADDFDYRVEEKPLKLRAEPNNQIAYNNNFRDNRIERRAEPLPFVEKAKAEKPRVYFSKLEPELLVHEYGDRFEVFRIENNRSVLDRVEYK